MSFFIVYAGFYTSLMDQGFRLPKKPGGCIKKGDFMQLKSMKWRTSIMIVCF
ncbi:hypothetical protein BAOM_2236 [Peribacillus asahii]|uniref:Uncharacterized protein n=1 Tax=Peribacillus asahii TaxID=228899 RepID=A0A3Q9RMZ6_9BACI|nr:hypothetical protein BAOM_2236 [Peribacillus asahii]